MASLGATAPQMLNAVKIAAEGAKVGGANLEDVTNALTAAIASGIPGVQNYSQAMGALNAIVGAGDMKMQDLAEAMGSGMMAVVKGYGLSLKDVGAALDVFGDNNIRGAHAATDLRMAVQALAVPAAAGKAKLQEHGPVDDEPGRHDAAARPARRPGGTAGPFQGGRGHRERAGSGHHRDLRQEGRRRPRRPDGPDGPAEVQVPGHHRRREQLRARRGRTRRQTTKQKLDELRATFESLGTSIGTKLLPVISTVASVLLKLAPVLSALAPAILAIVAAMTAWAAITKIIDILSDLNPWVLAIMAVIVVATLLVEHWKQVEAVAKTVFKAVTDAVSTAFDWIKAHWPLLLAILTGPIGVATLFIVTHWNQILNGAKSMINDVTSWFTRLPGMILHAVGDLGHLLWDAGVHVVEGFINGIESMFGQVASAALHMVESLGSKVLHALGIGSPSKVAHWWGEMVAQGIAGGMTDNTHVVSGAAARLAGGVTAGLGSAPGGYGGAGAGGPLMIQIAPGGGSSGLEQQFWTWLKNGVRAQGGDPRIFTKKAAFL